MVYIPTSAIQNHPRKTKDEYLCSYAHLYKDVQEQEST